MDFTQTLHAHLNAIAQRDLHSFLATVADDAALSLVLPNGAYIIGREAVTEFHSAWFADPDWHMNTTILRSLETAEMGLALLLVDYHDIDQNGTPYAKQYYLSLVFVKKGDKWLLTHDQNTFLPVEAAAQ